MNIISINANGLCSHSKFARILSKISIFHPKIILIQESFTQSQSPLSSFQISLYKSSWPGHFFYTKHLITLISPHFTANHVFTSADQRIMDITVSSPSLSFFVRNIYAPANEQENTIWWNNFPSILSSLPLIVGGDFNTTVQLRDRWSTSSYFHSSPKINLFPTLFPNLIDLAGCHPGHPKFTFFRNTINYSSKSRIDFILLSPSLINSSLSSFTFSLGSDSDHCAVVIKSSSIPSHPQWRMNTSYLSIPHVKDSISKILNSYHSPSSPSSWDNCKKDIKSFYKSISSSYSHKLKASIKNLTNRISKLENSPNPNSLQISHLKNILSNLEHKSFISLAIKSRTLWYEQGERSSSYFFNRYKIHQSNMNIEHLYIPSSQDSSSLFLSDNNHQILSHAHSHLSTLWSNPPPHRLKITPM